MSNHRHSPFLALALCVSLSSVDVPAQVTTEQTPLPAATGWNAAQIHTGDGGVWYARVAKVTPAYGAPEVIVTDDKGHLTVLSVYSGKWTARGVQPDRGWLAPSVPADVDPRVEGRELYAAGRHGNVHRITLQPKPFGKWGLASVEIGHAAGEEFHTVVAADLDPSTPQAELLAFAISGAVYQLEPGDQSPDQDDRAFNMRKLATIEGRVRDAVVVPGAGGSAPWIAGVSRSGHLLAMRIKRSRLERHILAHEPMGLGRIAHREGVLYVTRDDGVVLRFSSTGPAEGTQGNGHGSTWSREIIFAGAQGLRGIVAGRFHAHPSRESVMVYGYGQKVQHVSREGRGSWEVETVFAGEDRGHWLAVGEFDGRNGTDEVIATGFGGQVILVSRPPGYGLGDGVAVDADLKEVRSATTKSATAKRGTADRPWRLAVKGSEEALRELSPLNYQGGFETKSMVYETLVRRDKNGRIAPALASAWELSADGRTFTFTLRKGATFHDGMPVTAADVAVHFKRWVGLPEHAWLRCNQRITKVEALGPRRLRITLDRPHALLPDLCAINPTAIRGPGALNREGAHRRPIGSGPFAFVESREQGRVLRYRRHRPGSPDAPPSYVDLVRLEKTAQDDPLDALLRGEVDAALGSWLVRVNPARVHGLRNDPRFQILTAPGSSMTYLGFKLDSGPTANRELRHRIAAAVDRDELVRVVEHGFADPSTGWAAPSVAIWPQGKPPTASTSRQPALQRPLRILTGRRGSTLLAETLAGQLQRAGLPAEVASSSAWDIRIEVTHGVPYDPYTTAVSRFTPPANQRNAESPRFSAMDSRIPALMRKAMATSDDEARYKTYAEIQGLLDAEAVIVPLYARRRIAILRRGMPTPVLNHDMYTLDASWLTDTR